MMQGIRHPDDEERLRRAFAGEPGAPLVGITFLPTEAIEALPWGKSRAEPLLSVVCSELRPDFAFVPSWNADARRLCAEVAECGTAPLWVVRGAFDTVAAESGWNEVLRATVAGPDDLAPALDDAIHAARTLVREGLEQGIAGLVIAEDVAGADGPLVAPDYILSEIVPRLGRVAVAAAEEGLPVAWHSDGDLRPFLPAAARAGLDAIHPGGLETSHFGDLFLAAQGVGLVVLGGIPGDALRRGGPASMRAGVAAGVMASGGGLLVCDDGGISTGEELGMLVTALQMARRTGIQEES